MKGSQRVPDRFVGFMTFSSSASAMSLTSRRRDNLTLPQLFDALTTAHLSLVELDTTNGKYLSAFLSEVRDDTYHDSSSASAMSLTSRRAFGE
jgi:site-specific recombinase XerD